MKCEVQELASADWAHMRTPVTTHTTSHTPTRTHCTGRRGRRGEEGGEGGRKEGGGEGEGGRRGGRGGGRRGRREGGRRGGEGSHLTKQFCISTKHKKPHPSSAELLPPYPASGAEGIEEEVGNGMMVIQEFLQPLQDEQEPDAQGEEDEGGGPKLLLVVLPAGEVTTHESVSLLVHTHTHILGLRELVEGGAEQEAADSHAH